MNFFTKKTFTAIGLMSGTSMDGIDLALIESDGKKIIKNDSSVKKFFYQPYHADFKNRLNALIYGKPTLEEIKLVEKELTLLHAEIVNLFLSQQNILAQDIDFIGFHGHTIFHNAAKSLTWQIGDSELLQQKTKIKVIDNFRTHDIACGGQGAPLVPIYHFCLLANHSKPCAVLNIGGISNITYFPSEREDEIEAFDLCFGNAPFDDLMKIRLGREFDKDGEVGNRGKINFEIAEKILQNEIFYAKPPKSFDRNEFNKIVNIVEQLEISDALATLAFIHARAIKINFSSFKTCPKEIFICGGGRKNSTIIKAMEQELGSSTKVRMIDEIGFNGDAIEAEAFAFLAIRKFLGLKIGFEKTTGSKI